MAPRAVTIRRAETLFANDAARREAMLRRDRAADGMFYCAVTTTGVYCLASCAARPLPKNVVFYATGDEARAAGFRPCKRCRPERTEKWRIAERSSAGR